MRATAASPLAHMSFSKKFSIVSTAPAASAECAIPSAHPWTPASKLGPAFTLFGLGWGRDVFVLRMQQDDDVVELLEIAKAGIHPPDEMPFGWPGRAVEGGGLRGRHIAALLADARRLLAGGLGS